MSNRLSAWMVLTVVSALGCGTVSQGPTPVVSPISNSAPEPNRPGTSTTASNAKRPAATVVGTIAQVGAGRLTVRSQDDRDAVLDVTDATKVTVDGAPASITDLHPGMPVRASCDAAWRVLAVDASRGSNAASVGSGTGG